MDNINIRYKLSGLDNFVKRLNYWIGRLLGMEQQPLPSKGPRRTSNSVFVSIVLLFILLLWAMTGFYYIGSGKQAIILHQGRMVRLVVGQSAGFTYPYPWGDVYLFDSDSSKPQALNSNSVNIKEASIANPITTKAVVVLTKDLKALQLKGSFTYHIEDPLKTYSTIGKFRNSVMNNDELADISQLVHNELIYQLHLYTASQSFEQLKNMNLSIMSINIRNKANIALAPWGLQADVQLTSLNIESNSSTPVKSSISEEGKSVNLASKLMLEADQYSRDQVEVARANVNKYKQLLAQYKLDPQSVVDQMYYDTLAQINSENKKAQDKSYDLLFLDLPSLQTREHELSNDIESSVNASNNTQDSIRNVNRFGNLERR